MSRFFTHNPTHSQLIIKAQCLSALLFILANPGVHGAQSRLSTRPIDLSSRLDQQRQDELATNLKLNQPLERDLAGGEGSVIEIRGSMIAPRASRLSRVLDSIQVRPRPEIQRLAVHGR